MRSKRSQKHLVLGFALGCTSAIASAQNPDVHIHGALKNMMMHADISPQAALSTYSGSAGWWGLGAVAGLNVRTMTAIRLKRMLAVNPLAATAVNAWDIPNTNRVTPPAMDVSGPNAAMNATTLMVVFCVSDDIAPNAWAMLLILSMILRTTGASAFPIWICAPSMADFMDAMPPWA
jgi:hypothetical protein